VPYAVLEGLVAVGATIGNGLVIVAFHRERRLRRRTNYYIVSLAVADLLVGLVGIPCAVLSSVGLPRHLHLCMFSVSLIIVLCTVSILSLVAVSADRYWAILYPMAYSTNSNTKIAISKYLYTCTRDTSGALHAYLIYCCCRLPSWGRLNKIIEYKQILPIISLYRNPRPGVF